MIKNLRVSYDGMVFRPEEKIELEPNTNYIIQIISREDPLENKHKNAWELLEEMAGTYEAPEDWSREHDHYLYDTPKRNISDE
ncbi:hypothetical protein MiAbW_01765 [Microcystis aeruginosa NIES-4325]|uniref:DUF104 domain-containing protein n=1 Tax=Microcystis aeruginosa NIES-4325 TaxID=2569534 RepID=A0A5J4F9R5_MICAE|nr:hypothetical protein [Microcystis aeruginosa]GEA27205.1 hypothetical protein MiAbW_01765 [Microcystis aeruginosa NIES-4325]